MSKQEQKSAKPEDIKAGDRSPARSKDQSRDNGGQKGDMPGAEGPNSAGANEDTYD